MTLHGTQVYLHQSYSAIVATLAGRPGELSSQCRTNRLRWRWVIVGWGKETPEKIGYKCFTGPHTLQPYHFFGVFLLHGQPFPKLKRKSAFGKPVIFVLGQQAWRRAVANTYMGQQSAGKTGCLLLELGSHPEKVSLHHASPACEMLRETLQKKDNALKEYGVDWFSQVVYRHWFNLIL